jgi:hypothetical protein
VGLTYMQYDQDGKQDSASRRQELAQAAAAKAKARAAAACKQARRDKQPSKEDEMRARVERARLFSARLHKAKGSPVSDADTSQREQEAKLTSHSPLPSPSPLSSLSPYSDLCCPPSGGSQECG